MSSFEKVIGYRSIKRELLQICDMIRNRAIYEEMGARLPHGLLLYGDPGLGKSLLAKCFIEEAAVLQSCELLVVTGILQYHVVGIAVKGRFHVADADITEGVPAHQPLRKFKTAVFDHLGIESAVGAKVDILEEDTVHRWLDGRTRLGVDGQLSLSRCPCDGEQAKGQRDKHFSSMVHK